jgi:signal transduction histidine kinase
LTTAHQSPDPKAPPAPNGAGGAAANRAGPADAERLMTEPDARADDREPVLEHGTDVSAPGASTASNTEEQGARDGIASRLIQFLVILAASSWLILGLLHENQTLPAFAALFFAVIVTAVDLIPVPAWGGMQLSLSFPILLAVAIIFPVPVAGLIAFLGSIDPRELRGEVSLLKAFYNRSQMALSILVGSLTYHSIAGPQAPWYRVVPAVMVATILAYATNTFIVAFQASVHVHIPMRQILAKMHGTRPWEFLLSYLGLGLFGIVIARFYVIEGAWSVIVFLAPLIFARQMYFRSRALADQLAEQNTLLAEQAKRLEILLEKEHQTVDELRELNRMKGEFVAIVSHELRTPVTALIGYAKTLQQREFAEDEVLRQEFLERMERQGDRLLRLVENLLTTARLENKELPVSVHRVLFEDICREVVEGLSADANRVRVTMPDDLPVIHTDRQLLSRVVTNLVDNALKYSPDGEAVELGARHEPDGTAISFWIRDHGIGIPEEQVGRIFNRFYQVDSSSTRAFPGAGLGLALVADLLHHLGGTIRVDSMQGDGSTFTVCLPVRHQLAGPGKERMEEAPTGAPVR